MSVTRQLACRVAAAERIDAPTIARALRTSAQAVRGLRAAARPRGVCGRAHRCVAAWQHPRAPRHQHGLRGGARAAAGAGGTARAARACAHCSAHDGLHLKPCGASQVANTHAHTLSGCLRLPATASPALLPHAAARACSRLQSRRAGAAHERIGTFGALHGSRASTCMQAALHLRAWCGGCRCMGVIALRLSRRSMRHASAQAESCWPAVPHCPCPPCRPRATTCHAGACPPCVAIHRGGLSARTCGAARHRRAVHHCARAVRRRAAAGGGGRGARGSAGRMAVAAGVDGGRNLGTHRAEDEPAACSLCSHVRASPYEPVAPSTPTLLAVQEHLVASAQLAAPVSQIAFHPADVAQLATVVAAEGDDCLPRVVDDGSSGGGGGGGSGLHRWSLEPLLDGWELAARLVGRGHKATCCAWAPEVRRRVRRCLLRFGLFTRLVLTAQSHAGASHSSQECLSLLHRAPSGSIQQGMYVGTASGEVLLQDAGSGEVLARSARTPPAAPAPASGARARVTCLAVAAEGVLACGVEPAGSSKASDECTPDGSGSGSCAQAAPLVWLERGRPGHARLRQLQEAPGTA